MYFSTKTHSFYLSSPHEKTRTTENSIVDFCGGVLLLSLQERVIGETILKIINDLDDVVYV